MIDELDLALMEAWEVVGQRLLERPWERVKRMERVRRAELRRPVRAWAVAVRASDLRIGEGGYVPASAPVSASGSAPAEAGRPGRRWGDYGCETSEHLAYKGRRHRVTLTGARLAELVKPVRVVDEVSVPEMAALLGRDLRTVNDWLKKGVFRCRKERAYGRRGGPSWRLSTLRALDPQADWGSGPSGWWGTVWEEHWRRVPPELWMRLKRVPRLRSAKLHRRRVVGVESSAPAEAGRPGGRPGEVPGAGVIPGAEKWVGWDWVCPGREVVGRGGELVRVECGRVCKKLWLPLPSFGMGQYLAGRGSAGEAVWREMAVEGLFGVGLKGVGGGDCSAGGIGGERGLKRPRPALACARCWGLRHESLTHADARVRAEAWNRFVTVVSGGLLYGREVAEPGALPMEPA